MAKFLVFILILSSLKLSQAQETTLDSTFSDESTSIVNTSTELMTDTSFTTSTTTSTTSSTSTTSTTSSTSTTSTTSSTSTTSTTSSTTTTSTTSSTSTTSTTSSTTTTTTDFYTSHIIEETTAGFQTTQVTVETTTEHTTKPMTAETTIEETTEETTEPMTTEYDPCELIKPYCTCISSSSRIVCDEFDSFEQLDFSPFGYPNNQTTIIEVLELNPTAPLTLNDSLTISNLAVLTRVVLKKIDGIDLFSNPFRDVVWGNGAELQLAATTIRTIQPACDINLLPDDYVSIFSMFNTIQLGSDSSYNGSLCPLIFHNANISRFIITRMNGDNYLKFDQLLPADGGDIDLNANVESLDIGFSSGLIIDDQIIDRYAFGRLRRFNLVWCDLSRIDDKAFYHAQNLIDIKLGVNNMKTFIPSSNHTWMTNLNRNVRVNYSDPESIVENLENALLVTFDATNADVSYTYPDEDLAYFVNFPFERYVFALILDKNKLECSSTLQWLLQNAEYFEPIMSLNTTATSSCFTTTQTTTTQSTITFTTTTTPMWTNGYNNTESESKKVLLRVYLWTVIPIAVVCLLAIVGLVVFFCLYRSEKSKIRLLSNTNDENINLERV